MTSLPVSVAVLGTGVPADRIAAAVDGRADLTLTAHRPLTEAPPSGTTLVVVVPSLADDVKALVPQLLRDAFDVISTAPPESETEISEACVAAGRTFHSTGGFQSAVAARITRSLAAAVREVDHLELVEEIALPAEGLHPWSSPSESGVGGSADAARAAATAVAGWYTAGLRVLEEGGFGTVTDAESVVTVEVDADEWGAVHTVTATHVLDDRVTYRSVRTAGTAPLRYRLTTTTAVGRSTATVEFQPAGGVHPAEHLTAREVLDAIRPVHESGPGISRRDLAITYLSRDERL
ncbi:hypothetical protein [Rhodococcus gannanensis]|uniref:Uncharacterized protein n=1 Tax=Rhodococcus gannanensis TaxID=1960308 RepID=A0ABW4NY82_9NOCA